MDNFIYGKDSTERVVNVTVNEDTVDLYTEGKDGVKVQSRPYEGWLLFPYDIDGKCIELQGELHYKFAKKYHTRSSFNSDKMKLRARNVDFYAMFNQQEMYMVRTGVTYYKGMELSEASVLSVDIETTGLTLDEDSKVVLISNTLRKNGTVTRRLFSHDEYSSQAEMISEWAAWVCASDPSIILGHNLIGFDLPYLKHCLDDELLLGRDGSAAYFSKHLSQFRKDGSQSYDYSNIQIAGREIVDTFFLSIKYDVARRYPSYGLKAIIDYEGLTRQGREFYDASTIRDNYQIPSEMEKIKRYCVDDADDALALFDLMAPLYFYYSRSIPKSFQQIINGATGSQINAFLVRSYLAEAHSIPKASDAASYQGAISFGNPGIYKNVGKIDVASLYPSLILKHRIFDPQKDPRAHFLKMVDTFTKERLENKKKAKETGDRRYKDLEQAQKLVINSAYGFMGAPGLNFNSPENASKITKLGRKIVEEASEFAKMQGYVIPNADTDSISYAKPDGSLTEVEHQTFLNAMNIKFPSGIVWEDDGFYKTFAVVKAKNYFMQDKEGEVTIKGAALKATMKEPALKEFIGDAINHIIKGDIAGIVRDYDLLAYRISSSIDDIRPCCSKKTVTKSVISPKRTNESRVKDAINASGKTVKEGDKIYVYFKTPTELSLAESFDGTVDRDTLYRKLYDTVKILAPVIDISLFTNYKLKKSKEKLDEVIQRFSVRERQGFRDSKTHDGTVLAGPGRVGGLDIRGYSDRAIEQAGVYSNGGVK